MSQDYLFSEKQKQWVFQKNSFQKKCVDGAKHFTQQQLLMIIKQWNRTIKKNKTLSRSAKQTSMYDFFDSHANSFTPASVNLLKNILLNDNFIRLTWRADDLELGDHQIAILQEIMLEISTPDDMNQSYAYWRNFLMKEISYKNHAALQTYLENGYPVNILINKFGKTGLIMAIKAGSVHAVKLLINCPNLAVNAQDFTEFNTALHWAIKKGNQKIFKLILSHPKLDINIKNATGKTPLMLAATKNTKFFVKKILKKFPHVDLTATDHVGNTVFDLANQNLLQILSQRQLSLLSV